MQSRWAVERSHARLPQRRESLNSMPRTRMRARKQRSRTDRIKKTLKQSGKEREHSGKEVKFFEGHHSVVASTSSFPRGYLRIQEISAHEHHAHILAVHVLDSLEKKVWERMQNGLLCLQKPESIKLIRSIGVQLKHSSSSY